MLLLFSTVLVQLCALFFLVAFIQRLIVLLNQLFVPVPAARHEDFVGVNLSFLYLPFSIELLVHLPLTKDVVALNVEVLAVLRKRPIDDLGGGEFCDGSSRPFRCARAGCVLRKHCACRKKPESYGRYSHG